MVRPITIELSGPFGLQQRGVERLIRLLGPLLTLNDEALITVDLGRLVYMSPAALALFTAALKRVADLGFLAEGSELLPPRSPGVRNYLLRMHAIDLVAGDDFGSQLKKRPPTGFQPLLHFKDQQDYPVAASQLTEFLVEQATTDRLARASLRITLDEIAENVVHHADTPVGGFAAAQRWTRSNEVEIAVVDLGVGVRASLRKNPQHADVVSDVDAIARALQPRVTSTPERNAGIGLFITKLLLEANGGLLVVRSGYGLVQSGATQATSLEENVLPGTLVVLRARTDRPLDINSVYEHLELEHPKDDNDGQAG